MTASKKLGHLTLEVFLSQYWQKKPVVFRQVFPEVVDLIDEHELAGLAMEEFVESRLIMDTGKNDYQLKHGPFDEQTLAALPQQRCTLLVQAIDQYIPSASAFLDNFNFIPNWRIDDLMVSYARDKGSVGPHYDHYDVFLIQGKGQRVWEIAPPCDGSEPMLANLPLKILADFCGSEKIVLNPGDMLYLPSTVPHHGVSVGESMSFSVGFRAISDVEMLADFGLMLEELDFSRSYYQDEPLKVDASPGEITEGALQKAQVLLTSLCQNKSMLAQWLGRVMTTPKYIDRALEPDNSVTSQGLLNHLQRGGRLRRDESTPVAYFIEGEQMHFYLSGSQVQLPPGCDALAELLCSRRLLDGGDVLDCMPDEVAGEWLLTLIKRGAWYLERVN